MQLTDEIRHNTLLLEELKRLGFPCVEIVKAEIPPFGFIVKAWQAGTPGTYVKSEARSLSGALNGAINHLLSERAEAA